MNQHVRAAAGLCIVFGAWLGSAQAATESVVYSFTHGLDGYEPEQVFVGADGNFYGRSFDVPNDIGQAGGIIFGITPSGVATQLTRFHDNWTGDVVQASDGNLYGATANGGAGRPGVLYRLTTGGVRTILRTFSDGDAFTLHPLVIEGTDHKLYGVNAGTLYRYDPVGGAFQALHTFGSSEGEPIALVNGAGGAIYGATEFGGSKNHGTIFKYTAALGFQKLHDLDDAQGEGVGVSSLIRGADGNFYGNTFAGGGLQAGTMFKVTPAGALTVLVINFGTSNGPTALAQAADANFYEGFFYGGAGGEGTFYRVNQNGAVRLHAFHLRAGDGWNPHGSLVQGPDGNLYGAAAHGGANGWGAIFKVTNLAADVVEVSPDAAEELALDSHCVWGSVFDHNNVRKPNMPFAFQRVGANPGTASTASDATGLVTYCWAGANAGYDTLTATSGTLSDVASVYWAQRDVALTSKGYVEVLPLQQKVTIRPAAWLRDAITGAPLAGRTIRFYTGAFAPLCDAVTGADGKGECKTTLRQNLDTVTSLGYQAAFEGEQVYRSKMVAGSLICTGKNCTP